MAQGGEEQETDRLEIDIPATTTGSLDTDMVDSIGDIGDSGGGYISHIISTPHHHYAMTGPVAGRVAGPVVGRVVGHVAEQSSNWMEQVDPASGVPFYIDQVTGVMQWEKPDGNPGGELDGLDGLDGLAAPREPHLLPFEEDGEEDGEDGSSNSSTTAAATAANTPNTTNNTPNTPNTMGGTGDVGDAWDWYYLDTSGEYQGPFRTEDMRSWYVHHLRHHLRQKMIVG